MPSNVKTAVSPEKVEDVVFAENARKRHVASVENMPARKESGWGNEAVQLAAKGVIGAAIGVAGGMVLVSMAAAVGGAVLSWAAFAQVLGIAGAAGGISHGVVVKNNKDKK